MIINLNIHGLEIDYKKLSEAIVSSLQQALPKEVVADIKDEKIEVNHPETPLPVTVQTPSAEDKALNRKVNRKVKSIMILKGVTGREIARKAGVTPTWVSLVINRHKKSPRIQRAIAEALGVSYESLWNAAHPPKSPQREDFLN